ncbi:MAG: response regulator transcription factor [Gammaproteobacteria bacterium]|nr:response regulator transcription factor [Gammaproteobacteria bacterium]
MDNIAILLVEDTQAIATEVYDYLEGEGFLVDYAATGRQGLSMALARDYDVVVLDLMLPDISGMDVCRQLKQLCEPVPPVLMLTARDTLHDKLEGFEAGADDYLTKPFDLLELKLRCAALSKRRFLHSKQETLIGDLRVNSQQKSASRAGQPLNLSNTDFAILQALVESYPNAVSRQQIIRKVWGDDFPDTDVLRSHIYTLRQCVDKPFDKAMIKTIHGVGFRLEG